MGKSRKTRHRSLSTARKKAAISSWKKRSVSSKKIETARSLHSKEETTRPSSSKDKTLLYCSDSRCSPVFSPSENEAEDHEIECEPENKMKKSIFEVTGRRIVDIQHLFQQLKNTEHMPATSCGIADCEIISEQRQGFLSKYIVKCKVCNGKTSINSDRPNPPLNVNTGAVLGIMSIGCGYSHLEEFSSFLDIPRISPREYSSVHEDIGNVVDEIAVEEMEKAGIEESRIAKENNQIDNDGYPCISVIADGAWSKRSYKTKYSALSGVGCIIGAETNKLLYAGVRNKYCVICVRAENKKQQPKQHRCFKNWTGTSTSMESDIIVQGFQKSMNFHHLKFTRLIGDGDSSVTKRLFQVKPYGSLIIEKIECTNHLLRNFCSRLKELCKSSKSSLGKNVPIIFRKTLESNILKFRIAIVKAAQYRSKNHDTFTKQILMFKNYVNNIPDHIFGQHTNCDLYFCKGLKDNEVNLIPELEQCGLKQDIVTCLQRIVANAASCLLNKNNNPAEQFNSLICKFTGGKRINYSLKDSYQIRCGLAVISYNSKEKYVETLIKAFSNKEPGKFMLEFIRRRWSNISSKRKRAIIKAPPAKRIRAECGADQDYGEVDILSEEEIRSRKEKLEKMLKKSQEEIIDLEVNTRAQALNPLWKNERYYRLTASNFGRICKRRPTTPPNKLVLNLLYSTFSGNKSTRWGQDHERFAIDAFKQSTSLHVKDCGLFVGMGDEYFLGASPDGIIVEEDAIVEVKCPEKIKNSTIEEAVEKKQLDFLLKAEDGSIKLKHTHNYFYQIQGQLHLSKKKSCYFIVWTPKGSPHIEKIYASHTFWESNMRPKLTDFYFNFIIPEIIKHPI